MNRITLTGRLTKDPNLTYTSDNIAMCKFVIAVNEYNKKTNYIPCNAYGSIAMFIKQYLSKGRLISVDGKLINKIAKSNNTYYNNISVLCEKIESLDGKGNQDKVEIENIEQENELEDIF